tara:strand:+ start:1460 stop:1687 length:228 start_codon:yes stop_codon:yes gene_type:complete
MVDNYSTYVNGDRRADVVRDMTPKKGKWGCRYTVKEQLIGIEWYTGHSEMYAENAAENFVNGIKNSVNNKKVANG